MPPRPTRPPFDQLPDEHHPEPGTLVIEDQSLAYGFIQLPKQILWARNLSRDAKMLYAVLLGYAWQEERCFPGYGRLCADMGASDNFVRKCMRELQDARLLRQQRRGLGLTNLYTLTDLRRADLRVDPAHLKSRTSPGEVQEANNPRTSSREVLDPAWREVPDPAWREVKVETVEQETDKQETEYSNIRKASTPNKSGSDESRSAQKAAISRIRPVNISDIQGRGDIPQELLPDANLTTQTNSSRDMSSTGGGMVRLGDALLQRRRGRPSADEAEARRVIRQYVEDFGRELGDQAPKSSVTRAINLMQEAGVSLGLFIGALQDAKKTTQKRSGNIQKQGAGGLAQKNKMAYFFSVLEDQLGLRETVTAGAEEGPSRGHQGV